MWISTNDSALRPAIPARSAGAGRCRPHSCARPSVLLASAGLLVCGVLPAMNAWADHPASGIVEALQRKYQVTQTTTDAEQVTKDGTTMVMKCAGIYSLPATSMMLPQNTVEDGSIKSPSMFTRMTLEKMGSHVLQTGDKVFITKIESKGSSGDELRFDILTVTDLDVSGGDSQKKYKAVVSFKFKKGYLDETPPEEVEQAIEAVMAPDSGDDSQSNANSGQAQGPAQPASNPPPPQPAAAPPPPPAPPPPAAPAGPPPTISIGESSTQVLQALGMPLQMIDLGKKKTYIYKNMKIIFVDDKVSDVQ